uniref:mRNA (guanine-N(7))-methyltransferase n=1 Tax=viral metagenome TaxID=1070528 RepID=A0A6C0C225_9ZZZZ
MSTAEVLHFFSNSRIDKVTSFRALCNGLKALSIAGAVKALREHRKGRMCICDVGCGKGGDLGKWMPHRPKQFIGVDGSEQCITEARARYKNLVANGRGIMEAFFYVSDICNTDFVIPSQDEGVDVVCSNFFLQFAAIRSAVLLHVLQECHRVLPPGGIFVCLIPDGDRIWSLLQGAGDSNKFGHFNLIKCGGVSYEPAASALGMAYRFSLGGEDCSEYVLFPSLLQDYLLNIGFTGALMHDAFSLPAQDYFLNYKEELGVIEGILQGVNVSHTDWLTLGLFRVVMCRKSGSPARTEDASGMCTSAQLKEDC